MTAGGRQHDGADRRAFREFVRTHHPDRGGDPAAFLAGLARYDRGAVPRRATGELAADDPRLDAPIVVVRHKAGPLGLLDLAGRRYRRWRRPPRVR